MSIGGNPAVAGSVPLGSTVDKVMFNGNECDKVILDGVVVWERVYDISGTAVYSPVTKKVTYSVTLGDLSSWSYRAEKTGGGDTGEIAVSSGATAESPVLGVSEDGTWTVTFKGFKNGVHKSTATTTVTVATPTIDIASITELAAPTTPFDARGTQWTLHIDGVVSSNMSPVRFYSASEAVSILGTTHFGLNTANSTTITGGWGRLGTYSHTLYPTVWSYKNGYLSFSLTLNPGVQGAEIVSVYGEVAVSEQVPVGGTLTWIPQPAPYQSRGNPLGTSSANPYTGSVPQTPSGVLGKTFTLTRTA